MAAAKLKGPQLFVCPWSAQQMSPGKHGQHPVMQICSGKVGFERAEESVQAAAADLDFELDSLLTAADLLGDAQVIVV